MEGHWEVIWTILGGPLISFLTLGPGLGGTKEGARVWAVGVNLSGSKTPLAAGAPGGLGGTSKTALGPWGPLGGPGAREFLFGEPLWAPPLGGKKRFGGS